MADEGGVPPLPPPHDVKRFMGRLDYQPNEPVRVARKFIKPAPYSRNENVKPVVSADQRVYARMLSLGFTEVKKELFEEEVLVCGLFKGKLSRDVMMDVVGTNAIAVVDFWVEVHEELIMLCVQLVRLGRS
jgi:hypothetical protein